MTQERYQNIFKEKEKKYQYHREPNTNLSEEEKRKLSTEKSLFKL